MRKRYSIIIAVCITLLISLNACSFTQKKDVRSVSPQEAAGLLKNDFAVLVDVRENEELAEGYVKEAIHLPLSLKSHNKEDWEKRIAELPKDKELLIYCRSGARAKEIANELAQKGFRVGNLGGFSDLKKQNFAIVKPSSSGD